MNPLFDYSIFTLDHPGFDILYEDGPVFVVNKPSGVLIQAPVGIDNLVSRVKHFFQLRDGKSENQYLGVPHRLDRPASGAVVFARHVRAAQRLSQQFEGRLIGKKYWTIVQNQGDFPSDFGLDSGGTANQRGGEPAFSGLSGEWEDFIRKIPDEPVGEVCSPQKTEARWALLHFEVIAPVEIPVSVDQKDSIQRGTLLEIELETGRFHQIRIQAASRGHSIWGDTLYGAKTIFGPQTDDFRERAIALHSKYLRFKHPMRDEIVEVFAPLPEYWPESVRNRETVTAKQ